MDTNKITLPPLNERIYQAIFETCLDTIYEKPEYNELQRLNNLAFDKLDGIVDKETHDKVENLLAAAAWLVGKRMFDMGLAIGLEPGHIFDLPDMPW